VQAGGFWTFLLFALAGLIIAIFLALTVHSRPLDQSVEAAARRPRGAILFWKTNGFFANAGLNFSGPPSQGQQVFVYRSRPPVVLYPLYLLTLVTRKLTSSPFSLRLYVFYNQVLAWSVFTCLGFLGFRLARRLGAAPLALVAALTAQFLFATFPFNLERYFEPVPEQLILLFFLFLLIADDVVREADGRNLWLFRAVCVAALCYCARDLAIPGLAGYVAARTLAGDRPSRTARVVIPAALVGIGLHWLQLQFAVARYSQVVPVGGTFLWRSGLDGATNHVGVLAPWKVGEHSPVMRVLCAVAAAIILSVVVLTRGNRLRYEGSVIAALLGLYLLPVFLMSQSAMIHFYYNDLFLAMAALLAACCVLAPYIEGLTGNGGIPTWLVAMGGFCIGMYQLRSFAVAHLLPIPEPNWPAYMNIG
jgi:hypothetical protein